MTTIASQITSLARGCLLNRLFRRKSKKSSKFRVTGFSVGNSPGPVNSPHKGPVTRKMFPFDDVIMIIYMTIPPSAFFRSSLRLSISCPSTLSITIIATGIMWRSTMARVKMAPCCTPSVASGRPSASSVPPTIYSSNSTLTIPSRHVDLRCWRGSSHLKVGDGLAWHKSMNLKLVF